jgi:predicted phage-related endonuclease
MAQNMGKGDDNMTSFDTESRRSAIWATDARKIAAGRSADVWLEKTGQTEREDISHVEAVQWGIKLQDIIGREASARMQIELKEADYELRHPEHNWIASHFDFISADGKTLVEVKNYNQAKRNKYDENGLMPPEDKAQCVHEALVHRVDRIVLAVLFGGQELVLIDQRISEQEKNDLIQVEAELWGQIQTQTKPQALSAEDAKKLFKVSTDSVAFSSLQVEQACQQLKAIKDQIKKLEEAEDQLAGFIQGSMGEAGTLQSFDGRVLATWRSAKGSTRFDSSLLQKEMPEVYQRFMRDMPGSRRFLLK